MMSSPTCVLTLPITSPRRTAYGNACQHRGVVCIGFSRIIPDLHSYCSASFTSLVILVAPIHICSWPWFNTGCPTFQVPIVAHGHTISLGRTMTPSRIYPWLDFMLVSEYVYTHHHLSYVGYHQSRHFSCVASV